MAGEIEIKHSEQIRIGNTSNYYGGLIVGDYGGLIVGEKNKKFYWAIEGYDGEYWEEIPKLLFEALLKHERKK